ncbi:MAG TPA: family 20 glycosylhydrolase [Paludibacter sp.]|nr:family 20 glycosylhydrolase [Paludibacter sp.]
MKWAVPCCKIEDKPRFDYRGLHLDVCRHYFPVKFVKKYIDAMAIHKLNTFHWHLTDDQGWRIEIKKYPLLTRIGAYRVEKSADDPLKEVECGGFYTQQEAREIVEYARQRFITVIPEIEMPGQSMEVCLALLPLCILFLST